MAAAKIRDDLEGVVLLFDGTALKAGDTVPEGAEVGDHVLAKASTRSHAAKSDAAKGEADGKSEPAKGDQPATGGDAAKADGSDGAGN